MVLFLATGNASAATAPWSATGVFDFDHGTQVKAWGGAPTGERPESKLFYTPDNSWWAVLGDSGTGAVEGHGVYLYKLVSHVWQPQFRLPDSDPWMKADTLFDAATNTLFIALRDNRSASTNPRESQLYQYHYGLDGSWTLLSGPTLITRQSPETLTLAKDSLDRLWVSWEQAGKIKVSFTQPGSTQFSSPATDIPAPNNVSSDDVSAVLSYDGPDGPRIGVMWSDQVSKRFLFAHRDDDAPLDASSWSVETAYGQGVAGCAAGQACGDDHINLATYQGQIYAAVKTSLNDGADRVLTDPLIVVLRRAPDGTWQSFNVSPVSQNASRPVVQLQPGADKMFVFATYRGVHVWESSFTPPAFLEAPRRWTRGGTGNPTGTKQTTTVLTGMVVETSHRSDNDYYHNEFLPLP